MFFDEVKLELEGGKGGNGAVCFHREKFVAYGGPDGGNGGNGGSVILEADENFNTLQHFTGLKHFKAPHGEDGYKNDMAGHAGEDLILKVPVGTIVYEQASGDMIVDLKKQGQRFTAAKGGRGGFGNGHFGTSTRQAPDFAELGDIGSLLKVRFELRLVADVGLVGFPSAGKSTLISRVSSAKPKIGAYPFTTLIPNLGVVHMSNFGGSKDQGFVIADMPGIIEGASEGKGLGDTFLKHISRTAILIFLLDPFSYDGRGLNEQYATLFEELRKYDPTLLEKKFFVVINKIDSIPDEDRKKMQKDFLKKYPKLKTKLRMVSAVSGEGLPPFMFELWELVHKQKEKAPEVEETDDVMEYIPHALVDENSYEIEKIKEIHAPQFAPEVYGQVIDPEDKTKRMLYKVSGKRAEQIARMTNVAQEGGLARLYDVLQKMGIQNALIRAGARPGDYIKIGPHILEFHELI